MANNTTPSTNYTTDQNVFSVDINELYDNFITPIDKIRNRFTPTSQNSQQFSSLTYQESRCSAFYRMMGFPIVVPTGDLSNAQGFYSPGFDPNLNTDQSSRNTYNTYNQTVIQNTQFISQLDARENIFKASNTLWSSSGINATAAALASIYIRNLSQQFNDTVGPLKLDKSQTQSMPDRVKALTTYVNNTGLQANFTPSILQSVHLLKPFVVDPRIDNNIKPAANRICAPFLLDRSQTKIFQSVALMRPYIERVISVRFNTNNVIENSSIIQSVLSTIENDEQIIDQTAVGALNNTLSELYQSELAVFQQYFNIMTALMLTLHETIVNVEKINSTINFQPVPDQTNGIEVGSSGGTLAPITPAPNPPGNNGNNQRPELDWINLTVKKYNQELTFDAGLQGVPDTGDFAFSNLDDTVFEVLKSVPASFDDQITTITNKRDTYGNNGLDSLKTIEIIMGEFSGIGLIDIVAIQSALWIMDSSSLLGLVDSRALARAAKRKDLNLTGANPTDVITALQNFEQTLKNIYVLIYDYYLKLESGSLYTS
jgi:hypothetical protein